MKIVIINGSPRANGFTAAILRGIKKELLSKGAQVSYYDLGKLSLAQCRGCCACYRTGRCHIDDDAEMISDAISKADGLVFGTPTYASNVSGLMKVLIDRGHFVIEQLLKGRYCVTVATGENYGSSDAGKVLDKLVLYSGGRLADRIVVNAPFNSVTTEGRSGIAERYGARAAEKLFKAIGERKVYPLQAVFHKIIFNAGIKPFVHKKGDSYKGVIEKWQAG
ncbi:MAG: flavodoxin family protein [Clostridiales bacterium]|nr:flavodoxin family protein [Clostridiales bacterium]